MAVDCDVVIVGAGIIGLAIASALAEDERNIYILEQNSSHGMGISSRNSEVVHAGIYYPPSSLKGTLCVEGRERLYETCIKNSIPHKKTGKLIIATTDNELEKLEQLKDSALRNGVLSVAMISQSRIYDMEPHIKAVGALFSPETGIVSVHAIMDYYLHAAKAKGADIAYRTKVIEIEPVAEGYRIATLDSNGERFDIITEKVVNAAGLHSDEIAKMIGGNYALHYCKGDYFSIDGVRSGLVRRLVYPVPEKNHVGLGVHLTLDLSGRMKLGPDATYIDRVEDYRVDAAKRDLYYEAAVKFLPFIQRDNIIPDMSGIRPKLQGPGEEFRDFVISEDLPGFVNLVGIESPGLTAAPAIAGYVKDMLMGRRNNA